MDSFDNQMFNGKVAIVTGSASGIGLATASLLAARGARVLIVDTNAQKAKQECDTLRAAGAQVQAISADISLEADVARMVSCAMDIWGRIDILVNNAGIGGHHMFLDFPLDHWRRILDVNLTGAFLCSQAAGRIMVQQKWGRIVSIASINGIRASTGRAAYGTSKAGLIQLTQQIAVELGVQGVTANAIAPGTIVTPLMQADHTPGTHNAYMQMIPMHRFGAPVDIAAAVAFLCSEAAAFINGHTLCVDGGFTVAGMMTDDIGLKAPT